MPRQPRRSTFEALVEQERKLLTSKPIPHIDDYEQQVRHIIVGRINVYWEQWCDQLLKLLDDDPFRYFTEHMSDRDNFRRFIGDLQPFEDACQVAENRHNDSMKIPENATGDYRKMLMRIVKKLNGSPELHGLFLVVGWNEAAEDDPDYTWVRIR